ncbi:S8 family peptidase, partial [bacterium]|nr:S8 family peptidase [bacterium]
YNEQWPLPRYGMEDMWEMPLVDSTVLVAIIGTGLYVQHPDLQGNIWINPCEDIDGDGVPGDEDDLDGIDNDSNGLIDDLNGWNFFDQNNDLEDFYGMGTAEAGASGAVGNNGLGIAGMLWHCEILTAKATYLDLDGFEVFSMNAIINGIQYAVLQGARVIFLGYYHTALNAAERGVLEWAISNGVVVVAVTHGADRPYYPAAYDDVIGVAMIDSTAQLAIYGPPEDDDLCVYWHDFPVPSPSGIVGHMQSTLVAGAHVAGAAAYLFALYPEWTGEQVTQELYRLAVDITDANPGLEEYTGHGRLSLTGVSAAERPHAEIPADISLQVFPNPFNAQAKIAFVVNHSGPATVDIYNVLGMRVATLISTGSPGERQVIFDGSSLGSGVYFARFSSRRESGVARMILLK